MRGGERIGELPRDFDRFGQWQRTALQPRKQGFAFDVLEYDHHLAVEIEDVMHGGDVRVIERRGGARLAHQALAPFGRIGVGALHRLQRDLAIEPGVFRQPDDAHPAGTELADDVIRPDRCAGVHRVLLT